MLLWQLFCQFVGPYNPLLIKASTVFVSSLVSRIGHHCPSHGRVSTKAACQRECATSLSRQFRLRPAARAPCASPVLETTKFPHSSPRRDQRRSGCWKCPSDETR